MRWRLRSRADMSYMLRCTGGGGWSSFSMPSSPAARMTASPRYGLHVGSGERSSILVPIPRRAGMRIIALRFDTDQAMFVGASNPGVSRLYELTVGFVMAASARSEERRVGKVWGVGGA